RRGEWFTAEDRAGIADTAPACFRHTWKRLDDEEVTALLSNGKDALVSLAFSAEPRSLLDELPSRKKDPRVRASAPRIERVLYQLATDETQQAAGAAGRGGVPRSP